MIRKRSKTTLQAFFCAFWPKLISAKMGKLISKIVKLISETKKLISANPKTHFLRVFQAVLCYLFHKLTCNVQEKAKYWLKSIQKGPNSVLKCQNALKKSQNSFPRRKNSFPKAKNSFPKCQNSFPKGQNSFPRDFTWVASTGFRTKKKPDIHQQSHVDVTKIT